MAEQVAAARPEVQWVNPADLTPDPGNPRVIEPAKRARLRALMEKFGLVQNLVVNTRNGELVSGHQRRDLALELGIDSVPVIFIDVEPAEGRALALALNNAGAQGEWEPEQLAARLGELRNFDVLELTAFDTSELVALGVDPDEDPEDVAFKAKRGRDVEPSELPDEPVTQPGDIWELGDHRVICADSHTFDVRAFNEGPVDLVVTDPPYAIFGSSTGVASDVTDDRMVRPFFQSIARRIALASAKHGHAYVHCDWRSWAALWEGFRAGGLAVRNMVVWDKGGAGLGSNYANTHELIAFAHYVPKASNTFDNRRNSEYRAVNASNVFRANRPTGESRLHNAAKPVDLLERFIDLSSDEGGVVLDLFGGSGSTLIAAENLGRACIVIDHDPAWCDVIVERWRKLTGKKGRRKPGKAAAFVEAPAE